MVDIKPLCGWSGNPAGEDTVFIQNKKTTLTRNKLWIIRILILIKTHIKSKTDENRDNPPENSSKRRKGSKCFSSNLQKTEPPEYKTVLFMEKNIIICFFTFQCFFSRQHRRLLVGASPGIFWQRAEDP